MPGSVAAEVLQLLDDRGPGVTWSLLPSIETTVKCSVRMMRKIQHEQIRSIDVQQGAIDDIYAHFDEFHNNTVF